MRKAAGDGGGGTVSSGKQVRHKCHNGRLCRHFGRAKMGLLVQCLAFWAGQDVNVVEYVRTRQTCQRTKAEPAALWDAQPVHCSLAQHCTMNAPPGWVREELRMVAPCMSTGLPSVAVSPGKMGRKKASTASSLTNVCT
jgi:hypothetical protein